MKQKPAVKPVERRTHTPTDSKTSAESKRPVIHAVDNPEEKPSAVAAEDFLPVSIDSSGRPAGCFGQFDCWCFSPTYLTVAWKCSYYHLYVPSF